MPEADTHVSLCLKGHILSFFLYTWSGHARVLVFEKDTHVSLSLKRTNVSVCLKRTRTIFFSWKGHTRFLVFEHDLQQHVKCRKKQQQQQIRRFWGSMRSTICSLPMESRKMSLCDLMTCLKPVPRTCSQRHSYIGQVNSAQECILEALITWNIKEENIWQISEPLNTAIN